MCPKPTCVIAQGFQLQPSLTHDFALSLKHDLGLSRQLEPTIIIMASDVRTRLLRY